MKIRTSKKTIGSSMCYAGLALLTLLLSASFTMSAFAFQFDTGDFEGSFDTTLSYGLAWRVTDQDSKLIGLANDGRAYSVNYDDGNLNYDKGDLINNTAKVTSELALQYKWVGLFVRGTAFYDFENNDADRARTELRDDALDLVGTDVELLDAYVTVDFDVAKMPSQVRVGSQVLSWGESTFIQNGINVINPFAVSKLRVAGAELKEGLVPVGMITASISPTDNISFEAFYQYEWKEVVIDPPGSYWSTNDFAGEGGDKIMLGWGAVDDQGNTPSADTFMAVQRASNIYADDDGQYGIAMRVYAPGLNDTEFGFYFMNYHSRLPLISSKTGSLDGLTAAGNVATPANYGAVIAASAAGDVVAGVVAGMNVGMTQTQAGAIALASAATVGGTTDGGVRITAAVTAASTDAYAKTANYLIEYPEDIKLYGISFNTLLQKTGIALQGEISYRQDVPLQLDDIELLLATMEPLIIAKTGGLVDTSAYSQYSNSITPTDIFLNGGESIYIQGYDRFDVTQAQMTATKVFGPTFNADQFVMLGEVGITHVHGMPSKNEMRLNGPGTPVSGNPEHNDPTNPIAAHLGKDAEPSNAFADETSWGYRMIAKLDFNDAIGAVTLSPRIAWAHDVQGTTPGPGGNFIEDRKAITLGLGANYLNQWTADLSYTDYFGAGRYNLVNDRDFVAFNIKYSF